MPAVAAILFDDDPKGACMKILHVALLHAEVFFYETEKSRTLHGKIIQNIHATCKTFTKFAC